VTRPLSPSQRLALAVLRGEAVYDPPSKPRRVRTSSPWRGKNAMPKSERGIALRSKTGAPVGRR